MPFSALPFMHVAQFMERCARAETQPKKAALLRKFRAHFVEPVRAAADDVFQLYRLLCPDVRREAAMLAMCDACPCVTAVPPALPRREAAAVTHGSSRGDALPRREAGMLLHMQSRDACMQPCWPCVTHAHVLQLYRLLCPDLRPR